MTTRTDHEDDDRRVAEAGHGQLVLQPPADAGPVEPTARGGRCPNHGSPRSRCPDGPRSPPRGARPSGWRTRPDRRSPAGPRARRRADDRQRHPTSPPASGSCFAGQCRACQPASPARCAGRTAADRVVLRDGVQPVVLASLGGQRGDLDDPPGAVGVPGQLDDQVDGAVDLVPDAPRTESPRRSSRPASPAATARRTALLACTVASEPSWPVFMACSMSRASPPRTSPTMIRSGRIRSELRTRSRMVIAPLPSDVRRSGLQPDHVLLAERQLGGVLDRDDPLPRRDELRQRVQQRGLARGGAAGDDRC